MSLLLFVDLETTGLDPDRDFILEIGGILCRNDREVTEIDRFHRVLPFQAPTGKDWQIPDRVISMHEESGLWEDCAAERLRPGSLRYVSALETAIRDLVLFLSGYQGEDIHPAGRNPHFDMRFLQSNGFNVQRVSHRLLDTTTITRELALHPQGGELLSNLPHYGHRAIGDCEESIEILRRFRRSVSFAPVEPFQESPSAPNHTQGALVL